MVLMKIDIKRLDRGFIITVDNKTQIGVSDEKDLELKIHKLIADEVKVKDLMYFRNKKSMSIEIDTRSVS